MRLVGRRTVLSVITTLPHTATLNALTPSAAVKVNVGWRKFVSSLAMCLSGFLSSQGITSQGVHLVSNGLHVLCVTTWSISAKVVNCQVKTHFTNHQGIGQSVCINPLVLPQTEHTVTSHSTTRPFPTVITTTNRDLAPKSRDGFFGYLSNRRGFHIPIIAQVG